MTERFRDQFIPMLIDQQMPWSSSDSTIIRMPLSPECLKGGLELGLKRVNQIIDRFLEHASRTLIFLKSVLQVKVSSSLYSIFLLKTDISGLKLHCNFSSFCQPSLFMKKLVA